MLDEMEEMDDIGWGGLIVEGEAFVIVENCGV